MRRLLGGILRRLLMTRAAWPMIMAVGMLCLLGQGAIRLSSVSRAETQQVHILIGVLAMLAVMLPSYIRAGQVSLAILALVVMLLLAVLFTPSIKGSHRWFMLPGGIALQPSELAKPAFVLALAWFMRYRKDLGTFSGLFAPLFLAMVPMGLILIEPDLGTSLLFPPTLVAMLLAGGARIRHMLILALVGLLLVPVGYRFLKPYQRQRIESLVVQIHGSGQHDLRGDGYQQYQSKLSIGSGGMWGRGPEGADHIRHGILPEAYNDFVFAVIALRWGFVGSALVLLFYLAFYGAALEIVASTRDPFGRLLVVGLASMILTQALINIAMTAGVAPVVGIALPFISYGGSSLLTGFLAVGLMLNVSVRRINTLAPLPGETAMYR